MPLKGIPALCIPCNTGSIICCAIFFSKPSVTGAGGKSYGRLLDSRVVMGTISDKLRDMNRKMQLSDAELETALNKLRSFARKIDDADPGLMIASNVSGIGPKKTIYKGQLGEEHFVKMFRDFIKQKGFILSSFSP